VISDQLSVISYQLSVLSFEPKVLCRRLPFFVTDYWLLLTDN